LGGEVMLDLRTLHAKLPAELELILACSTSPRIAPDGSKLVIDIEAPNFLASLSAWPNGCVDIDLLPHGASEGGAWHREYSDTESALRELLEVLRLLPELPDSSDNQ
jgi:hypothetical protein